jgi:predicted SAM-dependent methyltransferase
MRRRLQFGCGENRLPAPWENFDLDCDIGKALPFPDACAEFIQAEHLIEHVHFTKGLLFLRECYRVLEPRGVIRLSFPDITRIKSLELARSALFDWGHVSSWTKEATIKILRTVGFAQIVVQSYGWSDLEALRGIDGHHKSAAIEVVVHETTVLEAYK